MTEHHYHFHFGRAAEADHKLDAILGTLKLMRTDMAKASAQEAQVVQTLIADVGQLLDQVAQLRQSVANADSVDDPQVVANMQALTELDGRIRTSLQNAQAAAPAADQASPQSG